MDPDDTPEPQKTKASFKSLLTPLGNVLPLLKNVLTSLGNLFTPLGNLSTPLGNLLTPLVNLLIPLKRLPIPKKLVIPAIAAALLTAGGAAFGLMHARHNSAMSQVKAVASEAKAGTSVLKAGTSEAKAGTSVLKAGTSEAKAGTSEVKAGTPKVKADVSAAPVAGATRPSPAGPSAACSDVVRDIYRQTVAEDPSVTLDEVRSEVLSSGVSCAPVPEIAAELKDLSPACRDMVQYTFLGVRDGHADITVKDVREKVVQKSVACDHDRAPNIVSRAPNIVSVVRNKVR